MRSTLLLVLLTIVLSGCVSATDANSRHAHGPTVLDWGVIGLSDVPTLDPALASDPTSITVASLVYGGLVRLDSHLRVQPDGAARWKISRDGLVYTFFLRHNLRFPSGRRVTAEDFAGALQRALGPEGASGTAPFYLGLIQQRSAIVQGGTQTTRGVTVVNPTTLRITLTRPAAHFLSELAFPASYVPDPTLMQRYGENWTEHAAGFGPYFVQAWHHSRSITLVSNPHYYGGKLPLQRITLHFYTSGDAGVTAFREGKVDLVSGWQAGETLKGQLSGIQRVPALALDYLAFNTRRNPFKHLSTRRAFASAWSPSLVGSAMGRTAVPARGYVPSAFGVSAAPWKPARTSQAYLKRAHYPQGRNFPRIALVMPHDPHLLALGQALQTAWLRRLGIGVHLRTLNSKNYSAVLDAHAFDIALVRWGGDYPDPQDFLGTQLGSSPDNVTGWSGTTYDDRITLADSYHPSDDRRQELFRAAALAAEGHMPLLPLDEPAVTALIRGSLHGVHLTALGTVCGDWVHARFAD